MRCVFALQRLARYFSYAAVAVGMLASSTLAARADAPCYAPYCPQYCPQAPDSSAMSPTPADPNAAPQAPTNQDLSLSQQGDSALAQSLSGDGANVGHIGRADNLNRLNIFDSQSAIPMNRVWYGFQYMGNFAVNTADGTQNNQILHRMGGEVKLTEMTSVSMQGQYSQFTSSGGGTATVSDWSNPQVMLKQVLYWDCDLVVSATMSVQFPIGGNAGTQFRENGTRLAPGLLFYYNTSCNLFNYGGFQVSVPVSSGAAVNTLDWSFGTGYWLYQTCCCCDRLQKVSLQYEVFGKHVLGNNLTTFGVGTVAEANCVVDMTFGASFFLRDGLRISSGYSLPVTSGFARQNEFITTIGYYF